MVWYDYPGKPTGVNGERGSQIMPSVIARVMPDGSTWYQYFERNSIGRATNVIEKWVADGTAYYRTNKFNYSSDGVDLLTWYGPTNELVSGRSYNSYHEVLTETNAVGDVTTYTYETSAPYRLKTVLTAGGLLSTNIYDSGGRLQTVVDSMSGTPLRTNIYTWLSGDLRTQTDPRGLTVTNTYDALARLTVLSDALGSATNYWDNLSRLVAVSNYFGQVQATTYDVEDRAIYATDANGVTVTNTYDNLGRLLTRTYPDAGSEKFGYSARGLTAYTNQLNLVTRYVYDEANRKTAETNANSEIIKYTYSAASDLLTLVDGKNQTNKWNYDLYGRVTNKVDQTSVEILRYKYDADSRLTNRWSKAKGDTKYTYDNVGNLTLVDYPSGTADITLSYDALNRLTNEVTAGLFTNKCTYYAGGLLATEDGPWASDTVTNTYNNARLRSGLVLQQPTGTWTNGFTYDAAHRLTNVTSSAGTFAYSYKVGQASRLPIKLSLPNTSYITNTYDSVARLTGTYLDNSSNTVLDKSEYLYNAGNQRIRHTRSDGSYYTNNYDNIGQLKWADSTVASEDHGYLYDAAWNLSKRTNNASTDTFSVDSKNQYTSGPHAERGHQERGQIKKGVRDDY